MKKTLLLLTIIVTSKVFGQYTAYNTNDKHFVFEAGMLYPLGKLSQKIAPMPNMGLWIKTKISEDASYDYGTSLSIMNGLQSFDYTKNDSIFSNTPRGLGGIVGIRYCQKVPLSKTNTNFNMEWCPTIGYAFLGYRSNFIAFANDNNTTPIGSEKKTKALSSVMIGHGIKLNYDNVGLQINYQFTPYSVFTKDIEKDYGSHSLVFGVVYRQ